ncbi:zincin-like metallopeptidase domain-containing protein, partial [Bradyrhizobium sp. 18]|uniref:zincin-like metallopeptidase domain-containing protein n=1 Tax=Bradyrhizobium sp. 18 TaxID=2782657 RepID=UPI001FF8468E
DWRDHAANRAQPSRCGIIWIAALCALCRYRHNVHWTGKACRLNRDHSGSFGSKSYAREELVAEMAGAFVCASLGIVPTVRHADYIGSWLEVLREDNRAVVRAASAASKAADFLLAFLPSASEPVIEENEEAT